MIIVYTGEGKGKTSASTGQAIRAFGQGMTVCFAQFMKRNGQAGEQRVLQELLKENFYAGGEGFFRKPEDYPSHREAVLNVLHWAQERLNVGKPDMLVLDEALYALGSGLLEEEELQGFVEECGKKNVHLVLSGRGLPSWLEERADLITEMRLIKHPYQKGIKAAKGIEF